MPYPKTIVLDYSPRGLMKTVPVTQFRFFGETDSDVEEFNKFTERKLDQRVSNLADASLMYPPMNSREVIRRSQLGEFGFTEVPANQIW
jgi:hypothetical protein